jgi:hypothetical protein
MDSDFLLKLAPKPHETVEAAFYRELANGLEDSTNQDHNENHDGVVEASYIWPEAGAYQRDIETHRQKLVDLALAPSCFRHTGRGWIAVYTPRDGMEWWIPLSNRPLQLEKLARDPQARKSGPIPDPSSRILTQEDLPLEQIVSEACMSVVPDPSSEERKEMRPSYIPSDATPATLASVLASNEFHAQPDLLSVVVRGRGLPLLLCANVDLDQPPKEVRLRTIYRRPIMFVGIHGGSKREGVAWITAHIALQKNPSREAFEEFGRIRQEADDAGGPLHLAFSPPSASLLICQKLKFPIGTGLETQRLVHTVRNFEQDVIRTTLQAADCNLLQGQELANLYVTINRPSQLAETAKSSNASAINDDPNDSRETENGKGGK